MLRNLPAGQRGCAPIRLGSGARSQSGGHELDIPLQTVHGTEHLGPLVAEATFSLLLQQLTHHPRQLQVSSPVLHLRGKLSLGCLMPFLLPTPFGLLLLRQPLLPVPSLKLLTPGHGIGSCS